LRRAQTTPEQLEAYRQQSVALVALGNSEAALANLAAALELDPNDARAYLERGKASSIMASVRLSMRPLSAAADEAPAQAEADEEEETPSCVLMTRACVAVAVTAAKETSPSTPSQLKSKLRCRLLLFLSLLSRRSADRARGDIRLIYYQLENKETEKHDNSSLMNQPRNID